MQEFIWIDWNTWKISTHGLAEGEVEFAWHHRQGELEKVHPKHGTYWESFGRCPSGRPILMMWRYDVDRDGDTKVFVVNAY